MSERLARNTAAHRTDVSVRSERRRAALRLIASAFMSAVVLRALWFLVPNALSITTPIVGYPIFANFDYKRYFDGFYTIAVGFPLLTVALVHLFSRVGPLRRSRPSAPMFPIRTADAEAPCSDHLGVRGSLGLGVLLRLAVPAFVVVVAASGAATVDPTGLNFDGLLWGIGYLAVVALFALAVPLGSRFRRATWIDRLAIANAFGCIAVVVVLYRLSRATNVRIANATTVVHYSWFPLWLTIAGIVVGAAIVARGAFRSSVRPEGLRELERHSLVFVGVIAVFVLLASLPGPMGTFGGFDDAQFLSGAQLTFVHGLLPWRDLYLLHGMIEDVFDGIIGMAVFSHSRWGSNAGLSLLVYPVAYAVTFGFAAYFGRKSRLVPIIAAVVIVTGQLPVIIRFAYAPFILIAFDLTLRRRSVAWSTTLGVLLVLESIVTPEITLLAAVTIATLVISELLARHRSDSLRKTFELSIAVLTAAIASGVLWCIYLVSTGSLGAFIDYFRVFGSDHALWGAIPLQWSLSGDPTLTVQFALPVALALATVWRSVAKLRRRDPFSSFDWCLVASAGFALIYFQKGLDRADGGHVLEVFCVSMPLVVLWGIEALSTADRWARVAILRFTTSVGRRASDRATAIRSGFAQLVAAGSPASCVAVVVTIALSPGFISIVRQAPGAMHAAVPAKPVLPLLGYTAPGAVDTAQIVALGELLAAYAPLPLPVFDFTNEPGITYFLLNRVPGSRFFHVEEAQTPIAQQLVISELAKSNPRLVVYTDYTFGLPSVDGVVGPVRNYIVSEYILRRYSPLADVDGQMVLIRNDLVGKVRPVASLQIPGVAPATHATYFDTFSCDWGDIPNFLSSTVSKRSVAVPLRGGTRESAQITGWAVDANELKPAKDVIAIVGRTIVGEAKPTIFRQDIANYYHSSAVTISGFLFSIANPKHERVRLYGVNADGTLSPIAAAPGSGVPDLYAPARHVASVIVNGRRRAVVAPRRLSGWINQVVSTPVRVFSFTVPRGQYSSLTLTSTQPIGNATFLLGTVPQDEGQLIKFSTLPRIGSSVSVDVGSCPQWYGYQGQLTLIEQGSTSGSLSLKLNA